MKGYKVFNPDWTCRGFQYEVGQTYEMEEKPELCENGFHFCKKPADCFNYYSFDSKNKVAEIEALGEIASDSDDSKQATNKICIVREIPWGEMLELVNTGSGNSGNCNSGNCNSGYCNSGNYNSGYYNSGNYNSGNYNSGNCNSGYCNSGNYNSGYYNSGCFNVDVPNLRFFDEETDVTFNDWYRSEACSILNRVRTTEWVNEQDMTTEDKNNHPEYKTIGGYLKLFKYKEAFEIWWSELTDNEKTIIKTEIPNFNAVKFEQITGINVNTIAGDSNA